ncbi:hypothetical protein [Phaeobacter sp. J2-8]|uniref:hypothetical protein n=1 Tax=Phaeobacter sp. J2-8 TaxID=2931394 RepID=UPI001FD2951F|nr:hypothetical protein [Phaeobacter sp. J2-8]MCJ7871289.1 hypothetical protein [Phaeobacter sp. J2-8]
MRLDPFPVIAAQVDDTPPPVILKIFWKQIGKDHRNHVTQQCVPVFDMPVERGWIDAKFRREMAHRKRLDTVAINELQGGFDNLGFAQLLLALAAPAWLSFFTLRQTFSNFWLVQKTLPRSVSAVKQISMRMVTRICFQPPILLYSVGMLIQVALLDGALANLRTASSCGPGQWSQDPLGCVRTI